MKTRKLLVLLLVVAAIGGVFSCKKKSNSSSGGNKLALIDVSSQGGVQHYRIVYDAFNNVDSMIIIGGGTDTGSNGYKVFNYFGSSYSITNQNKNSFTVYANTNGVILEVLTADTLFMTYSGAELTGLDTKTSIPTYPYYTIVPTYYTWANGDIITANTTPVLDSFTYNTAKSGQIGDGIRLDEFLAYGRPYIETNNLPTAKTSSGTWLYHYYYQFDNQGRVSQLLKVANNNGSAPDDSTVYNCQYFAD